MPELPEVEVVKRSLNKKILNLAIKRVEICDGNLRYKINKSETLKLVGKKIKRIRRRSKFLIFDIGTNIFMMAHLGMTGKFFFVDKDQKKIKTSFYYSLNKKKDRAHDRLIFYLQNNQKLIYNDTRKFGFIKIYKSLNPNDNPHLKKLGPEPLEKNYNIKYFKSYIYGKNRSIKNIMMDQKFISGLGNIYVNEILYYSGVRPTKNIKKLRDFEIAKIIKNTKKILKISIKEGGSSIKDFSSENGKTGSFQQYFKVYGRKNENCSNPDCKTPIKKITISNRASFYCPQCQH